MSSPRRVFWFVVRWVGGAIVVSAGVWALWAASVYIKGKRIAVCTEMGGFWDDEARTCYFLDCRGRVDEQSVTHPLGWKCAKKIN